MKLTIERNIHVRKNRKKILDVNDTMAEKNGRCLLKESPTDSVICISLNRSTQHQLEENERFHKAFMHPDRRSVDFVFIFCFGVRWN